MKKHYFLILLSFLLVQLSFGEECFYSQEPTNPTDSLALLALYHSAGGENWDDRWALEYPVCNWKGVTLDNGNVTEIDLKYSGLKGSIPSEIGNLLKLKTLKLRSNQLTGNIPKEIGNLIELNSLELGGNMLTGNIPKEIGNLTQLKSLELERNLLSGNLPNELGNLTLLEQLYLHRNKLTGSIPYELGSLTKLKKLYLYTNQLSGTIPSEIGNMASLTNLDISNNRLAGNIPKELGSLSNLARLYLFMNQLTGNIPKEFGNLSNLSILSLSRNRLTGNIPPELGNLTKLYNLYLYTNEFTGSIPIELGNLTNLDELYLSDNFLSGNIPKELANLIRLKDLNLSKNRLTGNIPSEFGNLTNLEDLYLFENKLTGDIPTQLVNLTELNRFGIWNNLFTSLPDFSGLTAFDNLGLNAKNNILGFSDIIPNLALAVNGITFDYMEQANVDDTTKVPLEVGDSYTFEVSELTSGTSYQWIKDGTSISGANSSTYVITNFSSTDEGSYTCIMNNTGVPNLTLHRNPIILETNKITGIKDISLSNSIILYPNPVKNVLTLEFPFDKYHISILDTNGKTITNFSVNNKNKMALDVSSYKEGIYIIKFQSENDISMTRFVK